MADDNAKYRPNLHADEVSRHHLRDEWLAVAYDLRSSIACASTVITEERPRVYYRFPVTSVLDWALDNTKISPGNTFLDSIRTT